jgi:flagellar basal body L-ring protein FlgH
MATISVLNKLQKNIKKAAKEAGQSVKTYRQNNPNNSDVKKLYQEKPAIKEGDALRAKNRELEAGFKAKNSSENKHYNTARKYAEGAGVDPNKIPQERFDDYIEYQMNSNNPIEGMYKLKNKNGEFTGDFRDVSTGKINRIDGTNKGGMILNPRPRKGTLDFRKGGMVLSTTDNRKKK